MNNRRLWICLGAVFLLSFAALGLIGRGIFMAAPPVPERVATADGRTIYSKADIQEGREIWQSLGGMELGSIWGHGGYVAPDWSADWLHREAEAVLAVYAREEGAASFAALDPERQAALRERLRRDLRTNSLNPQTQTILIGRERAEAIEVNAGHYSSVFGGDPAAAELRRQYAMAENNPLAAADTRKLGAFFFWTAWAAVTQRPGDTISYTNNWPHDPLVGNTPSTAIGMWLIASIIAMIAGIAWLSWYYARNGGDERAEVPARDPFLTLTITPSMRATTKYFVTVVGLFLAQILLGAITAHYAVEGQDF